MSDAPLCPNFDTCDGVHGVGLTLGHLDEVFRFCSGDYARCPVFAEQGAGGRGGASAEGDAGRAVGGTVACTVEGRALGGGCGHEHGHEYGRERLHEQGREHGLFEGTTPDGAEGDGRRHPGLRLRAS